MSFNEWKEVSFEESGLEIEDGDRGKKYPNKSQLLKEGYCPFLNNKNITGDKLNFEETDFITKERDEMLRKGKAYRGDIILTTRGSVGNVALFDENVKYNFVRINSGMVIIRNNKLFDLKFLYQQLKSPYMKSQYKNMSTGSAQPQLPIKDIRKLKLLIPALEEQKAIAHILSTIDEKIETNNQINKKLEKIAQAIFKQWFVEFEFPNEDGEPYKSSGGEMVESELGRIPKGWEVKKLGEICDVKGGKRLPKGKGVQDEKTQYPYIRVTDVNSGYVDMKSIKYIDEDTRKAISRYIINYEDVYISIAGTIGLVGTITKELDKASLTENMARIVTKGVNKYFIKLYLNSKDGQFQITSKAVGSTQPKLPLYAIKSIPIIVADESTDKKFSLIINSIFEKIENNLINSNYLGEIRDTLLPKLMSGEIRVPLNNKN